VRQGQGGWCAARRLEAARGVEGKEQVVCALWRQSLMVIGGVDIDVLGMGSG